MSFLQPKIKSAATLELSAFSISTLILVMRDFDASFDRQAVVKVDEAELVTLRAYATANTANYVAILKEYSSRKAGVAVITPFTYDHINTYSQNEDDDTTVKLTAFQIAVMQKGQQKLIPVAREGIKWTDKPYDHNAALLTTEIVNDTFINAKAKNGVSRMTSYSDTVFKDSDSVEQRTMSAVTLSDLVVGGAISTKTNVVGYDLAKVVYEVYSHAQAHVLIQALHEIVTRDPPVILASSTYADHPQSRKKIVNPITKVLSTPIKEQDATGARSTVIYKYRAIGFGQLMCESATSENKLSTFKSYTVAMGSRTKEKMIAGFVTGSPLGPQIYTWLKHLKLLQSLHREEDQIFVLDVSDGPLAIFLSYNLKCSVAFYSGTTMYETDQKKAFSSCSPMHYNEKPVFVNAEGKTLRNIKVYIGSVVSGQLKTLWASTSKHSKKALARKIADYTGDFVVSAQYPCIGDSTTGEVKVTCGTEEKILHIGLSHNIDALSVTLASNKDLLVTPVTAPVACAMILAFAHNSLSYRYHANPWPAIVLQFQNFVPKADSKFKYEKPGHGLVDFFNSIEYKLIPKSLATPGMDVGLMTSGARTHMENVVGDTLEKQIMKKAGKEAEVPVDEAPPVKQQTAREKELADRLKAAADQFAEGDADSDDEETEAKAEASESSEEETTKEKGDKDSE